MPDPRAVIVDDDPSFAQFVRKVARGCGYEATVVRYAAALPDEFAHSPPDLVVLDLHMPGTDGVEVLRVLADLSCRAHILVMSGADAKVVDTARRLGIARGLRMGAALTKPIELADLRQVLQRIKAELDAPAVAAGTEVARRSAG